MTCKPAEWRYDLQTNREGRSVTNGTALTDDAVTNRPLWDFVRPMQGAANLGSGTEARKTSGGVSAIGHELSHIPSLRSSGVVFSIPRRHPEPHVKAQWARIQDRSSRNERSSVCEGATRAVLLLALLTYAFGGCAANRAASGPSTNANLITQTEIESSHQPTLFDVVRALRPMWLRQGSSALQGAQENGITVYVDTQRVGGIEALREMASTTASSLHFYNASEAQSRFGLGNLRGVIEVITPHQTR